MVHSIITAAGSTGTDEPPGITALSLLPLSTPPAISRSVAKGVPMGTSKLPGLLTWPETEKILVPPEFSTPSPANHSPPCLRIAGTAASVSVLLMVVGLPKSPYCAGKGGLKRGCPFLPSMDSRSAVSSPQM